MNIYRNSDIYLKLILYIGLLTVNNDIIIDITYTDLLWFIH